MIVYLALAPLILLNGYASYLIARTDFEVPARRIYQLLFVWLVPCLGAVTVIYVNKESIRQPKYKSEVGNNPAVTPKGPYV